MPDHKTKMESMLFQAPTTYLGDYVKTDISAPVPTRYKAKEKTAKPGHLLLKDVHTLSQWKTKAIPFSLLHKPRPIIGTNPWTVQQKYELPPDVEREEAVRTRPRLVMTPAVSMDDVDDPHARSILCQDMYTSATNKALRDALKPYANVQAPFAKHPAPANPITLPKLVPPLVSPEWRKDTVQWDNRQLRAHCDATKRFWLNTELPKCTACEETAVVATHRNMARRMKK